MHTTIRIITEDGELVSETETADEYAAYGDLDQQQLDDGHIAQVISDDRILAEIAA